MLGRSRSLPAAAMTAIVSQPRIDTMRQLPYAHQFSISRDQHDQDEKRGGDEAVDRGCR
jgi:hypothetical protein